jgi:carbonic anhydrase
MTAAEAKMKLLTGNERFVAGKPENKDLGAYRRRELSEHGQHPFALIICCSDSRVPPEIIFDQGLGDLFVVRTAGNVVDDIGMGSIEYGAEHLHIPLIVVLGHEKCGAVKATVDSGLATVDAHGGEVHGCIGAIVSKIDEALKKAAGASDLYTACENENIKNVADEVRSNNVVAGLLNDRKVEVVGAKYGIADGRVTFM